MIQFNKQAGQKILELGGGANRHLQADINLDCRKVDGVDLVHDLSQFPFPLQSDEFEAVFSQFCIEHLSFTKTLDFLKECHRVCKPGGKILLILPNTENQIEWIKNNPDGWDDEDFFTSASKVLFGGQTYLSNFHAAFFNPSIIVDLLTKAGFSDVTVSPFGARSTDMVVDATKKAVIIPPAEKTVAKHVRPIPVGVPLREILKGGYITTNENKVVEVVKLEKPILEECIEYSVEKDGPLKGMKREEIFSREYFQGGSKVGGYAFEGYSDFPCHWTTAKKILERNPKSVVELGACKGHILKRISNHKIPAIGLEISKHCCLTRVSPFIQQQDLCAETWGPFWVPESGKKPVDLAYSIATFEHIPEEYLHVVLSNLRNISERGIHGIDFGEKDDGFDRTHSTLKSFSWWRAKFDEYGLQTHEIVDKETLEDMKYFPHESIQGTGFKVNLGCGFNQFWNNWINVDASDLGAYAQSRGHTFLKHDIRNGLGCFATAGVDAFYLGNILECLDTKSGYSLLKEIRRCIKPDGVIRLVVTDVEKLVDGFSKKELSEFDELSESVFSSQTQAEKFHALLNGNKSSVYDSVTLEKALNSAGFSVHKAEFNESRIGRDSILAETMESDMGGINMFYEATPASF